MRNTGDRLKECRIMKGLSRGEMSEMLHVSTDYLARLETGTQPVPSNQEYDGHNDTGNRENDSSD